MTGAALASLLNRLRTVAPHLGFSDEQTDALAQRGAGPLLDALARSVRDTDRADQVWLLLAAALGVFPDAEEVERVRRSMRRRPTHEAMGPVMRAGIRNPLGIGKAARIEIVTGVVVDVDFCARHRHNTGIQRVVRETVSRWDAEHDLQLVAWAVDGTAMRRLEADEHARVVDWAGAGSALPVSSRPVDPDDPVLLVPYRAVVVLPEVPQAHVAPALYGLARYSGNELALVGYDMIPVVSPNAVVPQEIEKFAAYLSIVKHADRVVGISDDAAAEFAGFASTLASQGLAGPVCSSAPLPIDTPGGELPDSGRDGARPLVLCVGSQEPRKNHGAVLFASEMLWREGLDFELVFIGGGSSLYTRAFDRKVEALRRAGRAVSVRRGVADRELVEAYRAARFTVFPSIHEGYGLPVAESLALGTPVVTTSYGPTGDIAADGGCLTVNPRSDASIMDAMRLLLTDDAEVQRLRDEIRQRPTRNWDDYARESWAQLVGAGARG